MLNHQRTLDAVSPLVHCLAISSKKMFYMERAPIALFHIPILLLLDREGSKWYYNNCENPYLYLFFYVTMQAEISVAVLTLNNKLNAS